MPSISDRGSREVKGSMETVLIFPSKKAKNKVYQCVLKT
jgi:hypothetical protein